MNRQADKVMMKDMKGGICGFLCLTKEATLYPGGHVASLPLRWAAKNEEQVKFLLAVIMTDCEIGNEKRLPQAKIVADCKIGI